MRTGGQSDLFYYVTENLYNNTLPPIGTVQSYADPILWIRTLIAPLFISALNYVCFHIGKIHLSILLFS